MKNHILRTLSISLISCYYTLITCGTVLAQVPQGIPYQAIACNTSGVAIANTAVKVRFSIRDSIATGPVRYQETHSPTTSALGLFSVNVGMGTVVNGSFSGINWGKNAKFLQVELDPAGGNSYTDLGTTQMMSVPYALYSHKADILSVSSTTCPASVFIPDGVCNAQVVIDLDINGPTFTVPDGKNLYINEIFYRNKGGNPPNYARFYINGIKVFENNARDICGSSILNQLILPPGAQISASVFSNGAYVCYTNMSENTTATLSGFLVDKKVDVLFLTSSYTVPSDKNFVQTNLNVSMPKIFKSGVVINATPTSFICGYLIPN